VNAAPDRLEELGREECLRLLGTVAIARVALSVGALPVVLPVNFCLDQGAVVFRTAAGTKLTAACHNTVIALEADSVDPVYQAGWSVLVRGRATEISDPAELARASRLPLRAWAGGKRDHFVRLVPELISGRRLARASEPVHNGHDQRR
jgi:nitroimidazol reductase NimA-like FMN-containing flavoprotein (pyridoxamine 5'-phosphate oxidase superfamily)